MIAVLTTHPIQYQTPIWRALASIPALPFVVYYMSDQGLAPRHDPGFRRPVGWDVELLDGYVHTFLEAKQGASQQSFAWLRLPPGFGGMLKDRGVRVLWVQGWQVIAYWQAVREARRAGIEVWLRGDSNLRSNSGRVPRWLKWTILKRLLNRVDRFLTVGKANRDLYVRMGYAEDRMSQAPHCVDNGRLAEQAATARRDRPALRAAWGIPDDAFCFVFVGKFSPKKNPLHLVDAVGRLQQRYPHRRFHTLWVGAGELGGAIAALSRVVCDGDRLRMDGGAPAGPAASFAGFLNQSEIAKAYVAADALVLPSDATETWGLVVNEAMATGLPCVVSDACGCAEDLVLPLRPDLVFAVGDIDGLARSLAAVIVDPPSPKLLQDHIERYDPARTVESVVALYQSRFGGA